MALLTRYVNTASTPGGDGTTNNTTGATRAYASLNEAEAAEQKDFVTAGDSLDLICEGSTADTTATVIDGSTTDATNYITIRVTAANQHNGAWDTGAYRISSTGEVPLSVKDPYTLITGLQLSKPSGNVRNCMEVYGVGNVVVDKVIAYGGNSSGFYVSGNAHPATFKNCLAYNNSSYGFTTSYGYNVVIINCSAVDNDKGFGGNIASGRDVTCTNCIGYGNTTADFANDGTGSLTVEYSDSKDTTANTFGGSNDVISISDPFTAYASDDFSLSASDSGTSTGAPSDDIIGTIRTEYSRGAFEYVSAGGGITLLDIERASMRGSNRGIMRGV